MLHNTFGSLLCIALLFQDSVLAAPRPRPDTGISYSNNILQPLSPQQINEASEKLNKAIKGFGSAEKTIIEVVAPKSSHDLLQIRETYKGSFGEDLISKLKDKLMGDFETVVVNMFTPLPTLDAMAMRDAIFGLGTDEQLLVEALALKSNAELAALKEAYQTRYQRDLEHEVIGDTSGDLRRFFVAMVTGFRDETGTSSTVDADVDALYAGGQARWGTEESVFIRILASKSYEHLAAVSKAYSAKHGKSFATIIKSEFSGTLQKVLISFVEAFEDYPTFLANRLEKAMAGLGTNEKRLSSLVVRAKFSGIIEPVKAAYLKKYRKSLLQRVKDETSGAYERILQIALIGDK